MRSDVNNFSFFDKSKNNLYKMLIYIMISFYSLFYLYFIFLYLYLYL